MKGIKPLIILPLLTLFGTGVLSAQEIPADPYKISMGLGAEINRNTIKDFAFAGVLTYDFAFASHFSAGIRMAYSHNFDALGTLEAELALRFYFFPRNSTGPFIQADGGASFIFHYDENHDEMYPAFLYGGTLGWRFHLGSFYLEPYTRGGYPFIWGGGLIAGISM
jgi:hypothetical protein